MCGVLRLQDRMSESIFSIPLADTSASQHTRDSRVEISVET